MQYRSTREVVEDLKRHGRLIEVDEPLSPHLEIAEVQRRVYARGGPAVLFTRPLGTHFPMVSNLFGTLDQARFLFRSTIERVRRAIELKIDPNAFFRAPLRYAGAPWTAWTMLPKSARTGPVLSHATSLSQLPQLVSWPDDGGAFVTLPQVLSQELPSEGTRPSLQRCNLGMYRIQLSGNDYVPDQEIGLHYQLHRGIGVHHQRALQRGAPFPVTITVGGTPAMTLSAVMPLPEGLSELTFAGAMAGHRIPMIEGADHAPIYADADFAICGLVDPTSLKPEGPFGDHLGYYARQHPFPWMRVTRVSHRPGAIWPFTVVGRPPQEDTTFGALIHELTGPIIPTVLPGVREVHAVDAAGVHPLLLAVGSERYTPYAKPTRPQELLTQANAILGQGQMSLAKYLFIADGTYHPELEAHDIQPFMHWMWERLDFESGLHFQTRTTIDTLDYSGEGLNRGSKVIFAASGQPRRTLRTALPDLGSLQSNIADARLCMAGVLAIEAKLEATLDQLMTMLHAVDKTTWEGIACVVLVDDAEFTARNLNNFLWVTFTRSNPATDIRGIGERIEDKHWCCSGPIVIDARRKPHHAPPLIEDPETTLRIDALAARGGPLSKFL
ncbi:MAG: UbiD family decarboxylase [Pirellula sp.]|nr:UbiD family decarboxylase [Pirellula sp.]